MAVKLIQASNNTANGIPIFTFHFKYVRHSWLLEALGLTKFAAVQRRLASQCYVTVVDYDRSVLLWQITNEVHVNRIEYAAIKLEVNEIVSFSRKIFKAVSDPKGRVSIEDIKKAAALFGPNFQSVLKQRNVGDFHNPVIYGSDSWHRYEATADGWRAV